MKDLPDTPTVGPNDPLPEDGMSAEDGMAFDALDRLLASDRIMVREGFADGIMACLPEPRWQPARRMPWLIAAILVVALGVVGSLVVGSDAGARSALGTVAAMGDLFVSSLVAGAGFLAASWSSLGSFARQSFSTSPSSFVALGIAVLALNVLLFRVVRRRAAVAVTRQSKE